MKVAPAEEKQRLVGDAGCGCEGAEAQRGAAKCAAYAKKFAGAGVRGPPKPSLAQTGFSFLGSLAGIATLGWIHLRLLQLSDPHHLVMLIGPFGASAVLVFSACKSPLAQPRNAILGSTIGALVGVAVVEAFRLAGLGQMVWLMGALAVSFTIALQELACAVHPPGGAMALAYVAVPPLQSLGYLYAVCPALLGTVALVAVGVVVNNLSEARVYPQGWGFGGTAAAADAQGPPSLWISRYFNKFRGAGVATPPRHSLMETGFSWLGSFLGLAMLGLIDAYVFPLAPALHLKLFIVPFGATAVLVFSAWKAPLAQPKHVVLGNTLGALVGVLVFKAMELAGLGSMLWLSGALAVSLTIAAQEIANISHPPGGATALSFVLLPALQPMGFSFVLCPALLGAVLLALGATAANNLSRARQYPQGWGFEDLRPPCFAAKAAAPKTSQVSPLDSETAGKPEAARAVVLSQGAAEEGRGAPLLPDRGPAGAAQ